MVHKNHHDYQINTLKDTLNMSYYLKDTPNMSYYYKYFQTEQCSLPQSAEIGNIAHRTKSTRPNAIKP